jgi:hypothetical protein
MKIRVSFKTPDAVEYAVKDALDYEDIATSDDFDEKKEEIMDIISTWVTYGESITVEFDTENFTSTVCRA